MILTEKKPKLSHTLCFMFSGKAGTGKSYSADLIRKLASSYSLDSFNGSFARGVKDTARYMGWDGAKDNKGRVLLQKIGYCGREYDINMWARTEFNYISNHYDYPFDIVTIDDWRFKNEFDYVLNSERLYRPIKIRIDAPEREILLNTDAYNDASETELDDYKFDHIVSNPIHFDISLEEQLRLILSFELQRSSI